MLRSTWLAVLVLAPVLVAAILAHPAWWLLVPAILGFWAFLILFFRNPTRSVPEEARVLVAPADGTIWDLEELDEPRALGERALRIGIFLSVFDVHVNRAPCDARVVSTRYLEGAYRDARSPLAALENESQEIGLEITEPECRGVRLFLRLVSGAIAKHIISPLASGDLVARGGLIGMIKYGSRTELWIPLSSGFRASVQIGDKVAGGASVLGCFEPRATEATRDVPHSLGASEDASSARGRHE